MSIGERSEARRELKSSALRYAAEEPIGEIASLWTASLLLNSLTETTSCAKTVLSEFKSKPRGTRAELCVRRRHKVGLGSWTARAAISSFGTLD